MRISKITPIGWCEGVTLAFFNLKKIVKLHRGKKIYLIGWLVHNESVTAEIKKMGVNVIDTSSNKMIALLRINDKKNSVIVFSAHGTDPKLIIFAQKKFKNVYNLTCKYVQKNLDRVAEELKFKKNILFYGTKKHPESSAFLALSPRVKLITDVKNLKKIKNNKTPTFATSQTTSTISGADEFRKSVLVKYTNSSYANGICESTKSRQENLLKKIKNFDVLVVVGDKKSNNTKSLVDVAISNGVDVKWVNNYSELSKTEFKKYKKCGLCSGASTPLKNINEVYDFLLTVK